MPKFNQLKKRKEHLLVGLILIAFTAVIAYANYYRYYNYRDYNYTVAEPLSECPQSILKPQFFAADGHYKTYEDEFYYAKQGIDVSEYQGQIDWRKVKAAGIDFAFIRLGGRGYQSGEIYDDAYFSVNFLNAKRAGIKVGVYFFSMAINVKEAIDEAYYVRNKLRGRSLDLPIAFDFEDVKGPQRTQFLKKEERNAIANAFLSKIEDFGYQGILYANPNWLKNKYDCHYVLHNNLWLAHYAELPSLDYRFQFWQYTSKGRVPGIEGPVDLNLMLLKKQP